MGGVSDSFNSHDQPSEQESLKARLICQDQLSFNATDFSGLQYIGGVDLSFKTVNEEEEGEVDEAKPDAVAALVVLSYPELKVVYKDFLEVKLTYPYIAGFLAFREVEPLTTLLERARITSPECFPQILLVDGNGILHPRGFGLASHLGVVVDLPSIGVAKNFLVIPDGNKLSMRSINYLTKNTSDFVSYLKGASGRIWGAMLRSPQSKNPIFVSIGHRISLDSAIRLVQSCSHYRIPEPIRQADLLSRGYIRKQEREEKK